MEGIKLSKITSGFFIDKMIRMGYSRSRIYKAMGETPQFIDDILEGKQSLMTYHVKAIEKEFNIRFDKFILEKLKKSNLPKELAGLKDNLHWQKLVMYSKKERGGKLLIEDIEQFIGAEKEKPKA